MWFAAAPDTPRLVTRLPLGTRGEAALHVTGGDLELAITSDGSRVVCDVARHEYMWRTSMNDFTPSYLHRWTFDLETGSAAEQQLDDGSLGFPRVDDRAVGLRHRVGWAVAQGASGFSRQ